MLDFYQTMGSRKFIEGTMPSLVESLRSLVAALTKPRAPHRVQVAATLLAGSGMEGAQDIKMVAREALALADELLKQDSTREG